MSNASIPLSAYPTLYPQVPFPSDFEFLNVTPWKQATLAFSTIMMTVGWAMVALAYFNGTYQPFKSKQLEVMLVAIISVTFFWLAELNTFQVVDQTGAFADCNFWIVWCNGPLGINLYLLAASYRMRRLYFLIVLAKGIAGYAFYLPLILFYAPSVLLAFYSSVVPWAWFTPYPCLLNNYGNLVPGCQQTNSVGFYLLFLLTLAQIFFCFFLGYRVGRIRRAFNEFKETKITLTTMAVFLLITMVTTALRLTDGVPAKIIGGILPASATLNAVILPLYEPCVGFLLNKEKYLAKWRKGMRDESLPESLSYGEASQNSSTGGSHASPPGSSASQSGIRKEVGKEKGDKKQDKNRMKLKMKYSFLNSGGRSSSNQSAGASMNKSQNRDD